MSFVVIIGNPNTGFHYYGPFATYHEAVQWGEDQMTVYWTGEVLIADRSDTGDVQ